MTKCASVALVFLFLAAPLLADPQSSGPVYPDHKNLLEWRDEQNVAHAVKSPQDWTRRRAHVVAGMEAVMGKLPDRSHLPPLDVQVSETFEGPKFTRLKLTFVAENSDRVPAYLFLPKPANAQHGPAMLALHQTTAIGKAEPAGLGGLENLHYGLELAERGYVVLCPDYPGFGDYKNYDFKDPAYASGSMKGIFNHMRAVDLLISRPEVDPERIGVIGHSLGGHNAMFVGVFDPRLKVVVSSCGWTPVHDYYGGNLKGWTSKTYMPRVRDVYQMDPDRMPFDFYEVVAALAPRSFFSNSPLHDANFDVSGVKKAIPEALKVFELYNAPNRLQVRYPDCKHDFPPEVRQQAYQFIDRELTRAEDQDLSAELPRIPPHEPAAALATFTTLPGFHMDLAAAEPLVNSPVAVAFDERGRMFVVEMKDYSEQATEHLGQIRMLEDTDGDGHYDKATVYVDHLSWPVAVTCYDGGIFVGVPPDILYCKDTKGDGKADVRKVVFTGFSRENVQGLMNSFQWSLDNRIQVATSSSGGMITCPSHPERPPVSISRRDFSFDPVTYEIVRESGGGQHGMSFDDWGRKFVCSNSDPIQLEMYEDRYVARNAFLAAPSARLLIAEDGTGGEVFRTSPVEPWRLVRTRLRVAGEAKGPIEGGGRASGYFSGATGTTIYRGDAWPAEYRGQAFVGDAGSNIVHRSVQEKKGVELIARRVDVKKEFVACNDIWFRPAQFANGPDGNLYCVDVYREVIEHPASLPPEIKKHLDLTSGRDRGRIYRILADGYVQRKPPNLGAATTAELVATLENPDGWHRDTASRLLFQRQDKSAIPALRKLAADSKSPLGRMHAMYALVGLKALTPEVVLAALSDSDAHVREHAVRLSEPFLEKSYPLRAKLVQMVDDDELMVRYQLAFSLGEFTGLDRNAALAKLAVRDGGDKWFRTAILSSLATGAGDVFGRLIAEESFRHNPATSGLLETLAQQIGAEHRDVEVIAAVKAVDAIPAADATLGQTIVRGLMQGLAKSGGAGDLVKPGSKADNILKQLLAAARKTATDENRPPAERADAVRSLSLGSFGETQELYTTLLDYRQPQDVQLAVLAALGSYADVSAAKIVIDAWPAMSPRLRLAATEAIFSRAAWLPALLTAVEEKKLAAVDIDTTRIKLLENHADSQIRERARKVFAGAKLGRRQDVVDAYRSVLELKGDAARGRLVFQKICSACHRQEGFGHELGPKLASLQNRGREFILINVLDPNREVNPQYLNYVVSTNNGRQLTGMVTAESATSITLTRGEGASDTVLRSEVDQLQSTGMSLMPEGLEKQLDKQGMADIIEYVMTVKN